MGSKQEYFLFTIGPAMIFSMMSFCVIAIIIHSTGLFLIAYFGSLFQLLTLQYIIEKKRQYEEDL